jgi:hypothetical protein
MVLTVTTEVLNDLLADLGVLNCDLAIADLQKVFAIFPHMAAY